MASHTASRPAYINSNSRSSPFDSQLSPYARPFVPSGLQLGLSYTPMSIVWPSQAVGANDVSINRPRSILMECAGTSSKPSGSTAIGQTSDSGKTRQKRNPVWPPHLLNSFVHLGPYLDLECPYLDLESELMTSRSLPRGISRLSRDFTVNVAYHSEAQQQDHHLLPGVTTTVGEYVTPRKGGGCDHRSRQLEAGFVKGFKCCQLRLNGMHELLDQ
jgi:hypothetical protein